MHQWQWSGPQSPSDGKASGLTSEPARVLHVSISTSQLESCEGNAPVIPIFSYGATARRGESRALERAYSMNWESYGLTRVEKSKEMQLIMSSRLVSLRTMPAYKRVVGTK